MRTSVDLGLQLQLELLVPWHQVEQFCIGA